MAHIEPLKNSGMVRSERAFVLVLVLVLVLVFGVGYDSCFLDYHVRTQSIIIMERN